MRKARLARALPGIIPLLLSLGLPPAVADELATLTGRVADYAGRPLAGASITVRGNGVGPRRVVSEADGSYRAPALRPLTEYAVSASHAGFREVRYEGIVLERGRTRVVDFRLKTPDTREVVALVSRDPFPYQELLRGLGLRLAVPLRVIELDEEADPAEVVRRVRAERPNVIVGAGLRAARLIRREVRDVPSILTLLPDPRRFDLTAANICFLTHEVRAEATVARVLEMLPRARRLGILYDAATSSLVARDVRLAAARRGLSTELRPCHDLDHLGRALESLRGRIDALVVPYDRLTATGRAADAITAWSLRQGVPLAAPDPDWVRRGALFSYGAAPHRIGEEASRLASQILAGARQPSDLDLQRPEPDPPRVNRDTAERLGIDLPPTLGDEIDL
jgi:putative ABC transport system substrate-binding protein